MEHMQLVLNMFLNVSSNGEVLFFRNWMEKQPEVLEAIRQTEFGPQMLEQWELL
jgi:hypothetical protein